MPILQRGRRNSQSAELSYSAWVVAVQGTLVNNQGREAGRTTKGADIRVGDSAKNRSKLKTPLSSAGQNDCSDYHRRMLRERNTVEIMKVTKMIREIHAHL